MNGIRFLQTTPRIVMGQGSLDRIGEESKRLGASRVMIVTDKGLVESGIVTRAEAVLESDGMSVGRFDAVEADPPYEIAAVAAEHAKKQDAELILGIGGGSSLDIAKVASVLVTNSEPVSAYFGIDLIPLRGLPTILVPTTAGTGSEATPIAILSDHTEKLKKGIVSPFLFPDTAVLDPELTLGLPPKVTAATGMDALTHAIESVTSKGAYDLTRSLALDAVRLIGEWLPVAVAQGDNREARERMMMACLEGGIAFNQSGLTIVHSMSHPVSGWCGTAHGVANAILLPHVMAFNAAYDIEGFARVAEALGVKTAGMTKLQAAEASVERVRELNTIVGIPDGLASCGVTEADFSNLIADSMKSAGIGRNPRPTTAEDVEAIYRQAM